MHSRIYEGTVRHRRYAPIEHRFRYRLYWMYLDLDELDDLFRGRWFWSNGRRNLCSFHREDHLGRSAEPLEESVRNLVERELDRRPAGPIRLLTQLRHCGFVMNPISLYFCYDAAGEEVDAVVVEVHNTPWGEQHCYVLNTCLSDPSPSKRVCVEKEFHVSPYMGMRQTYVFRLRKPGRRLVAHIENRECGSKLFDATLVLNERSFSRWNLSRMLLRFPLASLRIAASIYWQAFRLWLKGAPYYPHPKTLEDTKAIVS
jgi:DUF1365 family protein